MSGMGTLLRGALPPAITVVACLPLLAVRESVAHGNELLNALRSIGAVALVVGLVGGWIRQRDAIRSWYRDASQQATAAKKKPAEPSNTSSQGTPS
jgi:protein-S-isoprenylcysteine O-methyltransferase Ste14